MFLRLNNGLLGIKARVCLVCGAQSDKRAGVVMSDDERGDVATRFQKGNNEWEKRSSHGRNPILKSPDDLWTACCEYFT